MPFSWQDRKAVIMGILNITPDSFSDGGRYTTIDAALAKARELKAQGADIIDLGAESTRPGAEPISALEEERRLRPILEALVAENPGPLSVDTYRVETARLALELGVGIINDIHGIDVNNEMARLIADHLATWIIMDYKPIKSSQEAFSRMALAIEKAKKSAPGANQLIVDFGLGFNKDRDDNISLTRAIPHYKALNLPLLYAPSRKRFLGEITGQQDPTQRDLATAAICAIAASLGADIFRVHNVAIVKEALKVGSSFYQGKLFRE